MEFSGLSHQYGKNSLRCLLTNMIKAFRGSWGLKLLPNVAKALAYFLRISSWRTFSVKFHPSAALSFQGFSVEGPSVSSFIHPLLGVTHATEVKAGWFRNLEADVTAKNSPAPAKAVFSGPLWWLRYGIVISHEPYLSQGKHLVPWFCRFFFFFFWSL